MGSDIIMLHGGTFRCHPACIVASDGIIARVVRCGLETDCLTNGYLDLLNRLELWGRFSVSV
jgi:hypothetical protein